jgi:hypothetical protein
MSHTLKLALLTLLLVPFAARAAATTPPGAPAAQVTTHSVSLTWLASVTPNVVSYNAKRSNTSGGPYVTLNTSVITTLSYLDTSIAAGQVYYYVITAIDSLGNESANSVEVSATIPGGSTGGGGSTLSFWPNTQLPANVTGNDGNSVELGIKFSTSVPGEIVGIKFFKATNATGPHTAHLWNPNGNSLGNGTFTNETVSGWQTFTFPSPIIITPGMVYTASIHTAQYAWNEPAFTTPLVVGPLSAPVSAGVYAYGSTSAYPTKLSSPTANYWVDVNFLPTGTQPVTVTVSPATTTLAENAIQQFTATVGGTMNTAVTWTATGGTIDTTGLYKAGTTPGTAFSAKATSVADPTKSGSAVVTITAPLATMSMTCSNLVCTITQTNNPTGTRFPVSATGPNGQTANATAVVP